ncbi:hypothetical protein EDF46_2243 [Frondihabitans sp. PhB188]|uniref:hypothetical protein n=1 Tax=Frondihabitans sp. PhB188 TaxID=2485200 RepID=UPI000F473810|nr:hypothetical protein [Frondihabitans sp. PhB188]ROQ38603.1 hypothetical protein EDF46_2243 [Frondihabitans sp. PhB188]
MTASLRTAVRIAWASLPESRDRRLLAVRFVGTPLAAALFYFAMSAAGGGARDAGDAVAAAIGAGASGAAVSVAVLLASDRFEGTLPFLLMASRGTVVAWLGRASVLLTVGIGMASVGAVVPLALVGGVGGLDRVAGVALAFVAVAPASAGVGFLVGSVGLRMRDSLFLANAAEFLLPLVTGVVAPLSTLPVGMAGVLRLIPIADVIDAARVAATAGTTPAYWSDLGLAALASVAWGAAAVASWVFFGRLARRTGSADGFAGG